MTGQNQRMRLCKTTATPPPKPSRPLPPPPRFTLPSLALAAVLSLGALVNDDHRLQGLALQEHRLHLTAVRGGGGSEKEEKKRRTQDRGGAAASLAAGSRGGASSARHLAPCLALLLTVALRFLASSCFAQQSRPQQPEEDEREGVGRYVRSRGEDMLEGAAQIVSQTDPLRAFGLQARWWEWRFCACGALQNVLRRPGWLLFFCRP